MAPLRITRLRPDKKHQQTPVSARRVQPVPELVPHKVQLPPEPVRERGSDRVENALHDEQQVVRVETLMLKGFRVRATLMQLLGVESTALMDGYMRRVYARWEQAGATQDLARHRGEAIAKLEQLMQECWVTYQNATDEDGMIKVAAIKTLKDLQQQHAQMLGLTPEVIAKLATAEGGVDVGAFPKRLAAHDTLTRFAVRLAAMIEERTAGMKTIEHAPSG